MHTIIPSARLLYHSNTHAFGSPFKLYVNPTTTCGPASGIMGDGLSYATAGIQAAFTIQARDVYDNTKTKLEDTFVVRSTATDSISPDAPGGFGHHAWSTLSKDGACILVGVLLGICIHMYTYSTYRFTDLLIQYMSMYM